MARTLLSGFKLFRKNVCLFVWIEIVYLWHLCSVLLCDVVAWCKSANNGDGVVNSIKLYFKNTYFDNQRRMLFFSLFCTKMFVRSERAFLMCFLSNFVRIFLLPPFSDEGTIRNETLCSENERERERLSSQIYLSFSLSLPLSLSHLSR